MRSIHQSDALSHGDPAPPTPLLVPPTLLAACPAQRAQKKKNGASLQCTFSGIMAVHLPGGWAGGWALPRSVVGWWGAPRCSRRGTLDVNVLGCPLNSATRFSHVCNEFPLFWLLFEFPFIFACVLDSYWILENTFLPFVFVFLINSNSNVVIRIRKNKHNFSRGRDALQFHFFYLRVVYLN